MSEVLEPRPDTAAGVFGDRLSLAELFAERLAGSGVERGLVGPREVPRIWSRHVLNCAVLAELLAPDVDVLDVGSGAGLPGIAIAIARPDVTVTLVEPLERRTTWLHEVVEELGLPVRVVRGRAEDLVGHLDADVVTARAVAPLPRLAGWGLPLLRPGGELLAVKGRTAAEELAGATRRLRELGAVSSEVVTCGEQVQETPTTVVRVRVGQRPPGPTRAPQHDEPRRSSTGAGGTSSRGTTSRGTGGSKVTKGSKGSKGGKGAASTSTGGTNRGSTSRGGRSGTSGDRRRG